MTHPEVEVLDNGSKQFLMEEVSLVSKCSSCHDNLADKYVAYNSSVKQKNSLDKIELVKSHSFRGAEMRGYDNYAETDFGYYYYYPWWFDSYVVNSGIYNIIPPADETIAKSEEQRRRQSYRRGSGRLRLSTPAMPISSSFSPTPTVPLNVISTPIVVDSTRQNGST